MRMWLDDIREAPEGWLWCKTSREALQAIDKYRDELTTVSFDHDLGGDDTTRIVVTYLCTYGWGNITTAYVHTANPVGREWLEGTIRDHGPGVTRWT